MDHPVSELEVYVFCKQNTAYEMRISDWSSDVCSSDLSQRHGARDDLARDRRGDAEPVETAATDARRRNLEPLGKKHNGHGLAVYADEADILAQASAKLTCSAGVRPEHFVAKE